jgi:hypothetical protein
MKEQATYPEHIGVSDVTTRSFEMMRVEGARVESHQKTP